MFLFCYHLIPCAIWNRHKLMQRTKFQNNLVDLRCRIENWKIFTFSSFKLENVKIDPFSSLVREWLNMRNRFILINYDVLLLKHMEGDDS